MGIIVSSPYSGRPVKVRDQDVGRAVRDEEGRIFYVLLKRDGSGHYGALTRAGGEKDEKRAAEMEAKYAAAKQSGEERSQMQIHDATGRRRSNVRGKLVILFLMLMVALLVWLFTLGPFNPENIQRGQTPPPNEIRENWRPDRPPALPEDTPQTPVPDTTS